MSGTPPEPPEHWEDKVEPKTDLARFVLESRKRRRAAGERFLTLDEIDVLLGRRDEPET